MERLAFLRASFIPVLGNAETAIKCFAVVHPFLHKKILHTELTPFPDIVDVITDKVLRYGVLTVSKLWDNARTSKSVPTLIKKMESAFPESSAFLAMRSEVRAMEQSDIVLRLRRFRNKFLAHNEGAEFDATMSFTPIEIVCLLFDTLRIVDGIQEVLHGLSFESKARYDSYASDALFDWCELLHVSVPIAQNSNEIDAWTHSDGDE